MQIDFSYVTTCCEAVRFALPSSSLAKITDWKKNQILCEKNMSDFAAFRTRLVKSPGSSSPPSRYMQQIYGI